MKILENISLKVYNTFGIDKKANFFVVVSSIDELKEALLWARARSLKSLILGGGSNILLTQDQDVLLIKMEIGGIELISEDKDHLNVEVGAGENWHEFVLHAIAQQWAGIENLSLIPGTVGASPMQNIGAYGVELKDVFESLKALNRQTLEVETFSKEDCKFAYRESIFKTDLKDKYVICSVRFKLNKKATFHLDYGAIRETIAASNSNDLTIQSVSDAVIKIRQSKLPDPKEIGNAGSFFKNPTISEEQYSGLKEIHQLIPGYVTEQGIKVPAAWLIEQSGWKGKRFGEIGVHVHQPLVLVNYGNGDGKEIQKLAEEIQQSVWDKFKIEIQPEVNFL